MSKQRSNATKLFDSLQKEASQQINKLAHRAAFADDPQKTAAKLKPVIERRVSKRKKPFKPNK
jgi:hypothetical protein